MGARTLALAATMAAGALLATALPAQAGSAAGPVVTPTGMRVVSEVSSDGRVLGSGDGTLVLLDLATMTRTPHGLFVMDNSDLSVANEGGWSRPADPYADPVFQAGPVWLLNTAKGTRQRLDSDSAGTPLVPSWAATCSENEDCQPWDDPTVWVGLQSVSKDGRIVAFCANYRAPTTYDLYVKDLSTGRLKRYAGLCAAGGPEEFRTQEYFLIGGPEVSEDGLVVHVCGAVNWEDPLTAFYPDSLVFTRTGKVRSINGQGSMTRDGKQLFMRIGTRAYRTPDRTGGKVGVYNVATKKTTRLPGRYTIYGTPAFTFSAFDQATRHGRYVTYGDRAAVIDRTTGVTVDLAAIVRKAGYEPTAITEFDWYYPSISNDGSTVLISTGEDQEDGGGTQMVAVTGWQPTAVAHVKAVAGGSKVFVDVDPNKGRGFWTFTVDRLNRDGTWSKIGGTKRTVGAKESRVIDLKAGTYRIVVKPKYGYQGSLSDPVLLNR